MGCISDVDEPDTKLLEIAKRYEDTDPDIALMALGHRPSWQIEAEHQRNDRDNEADTIALRIADAMAIAGNIRMQIEALMG